MKQILFAFVAICILSSIAAAKTLQVIKPVRYSLIGEWAVQNDTNIVLTFEADSLTLKGCNINACSYKSENRDFKRGQFCRSTRRFCQEDRDRQYLASLAQASSYIVTKHHIIFFNAKGDTVLILVKIANGKPTATHVNLDKLYKQTPNQSLEGSWVFSDNPSISVAFGDGRFTLQGCNTISCNFSLKGNGASEEPCTSTLIACENDNDRVYLAKIQATRSVKINKNTAILQDQWGKTVAKLVRSGKSS